MVSGDLDSHVPGLNRYGDKPPADPNRTTITSLMDLTFVPNPRDDTLAATVYSTPLCSAVFTPSGAASILTPLPNTVIGRDDQLA